GLFWVLEAMRGWLIARCSRPLYQLLDVLAFSATVTRAGTPYTESIKLSQRVSQLGQPLRTFADHASSDFGNRQALRSNLVDHVNQVDATFGKVANQLVSDRESSARKLGELAALGANSIAVGRFAAILPAEELAVDAPLEPDQLDGRRLAKACLWSVASVTTFFLALSLLGAPSALLLPMAMIAFIVLVYGILAFQYGLLEASRLTRSIGGFFSANPPI
ncbi:hypothetical protein, partial [Streptomyces sp. Ag109_O5-10]|uniref:hypothetical protein n=1 Tax=Streptomyces sp. Ag109_O5-10 TaxID=1855349 RepID=UPI00089597C6